MTEALFGLQILCSTLSAVSFAMVRFSQRDAWLWMMAPAILGLVVCVTLAPGIQGLVSTAQTRP